MMDRDTKLIAILRRQYHIILTALGENIFRIGRSREATEPNTEYIFSQLAYFLPTNLILILSARLGLARRGSLNRVKGVSF